MRSAFPYQLFVFCLLFLISEEEEEERTDIPLQLRALPGLSKRGGDGEITQEEKREGSLPGVKGGGG